MQKNEGGFSLLEIMIAMAIFSIVVLGLAQLQIHVVNQRISTKKYSKALNYAEELIEHVRMTPYVNVNATDMAGDIPIPSPDDTVFDRALTTDSGNTIKLVTVKVRWRNFQGNFATRNSLQLSTKIWVFHD